MRTLRTRRSAVLCYHGVGPSTTRIDPGFLRVEPAAFRAQLDLLLEAGFDLVLAGFEVGAHTVTHPDLSRLDFESCLREMSDSRQALERLLGVRVRTFAYPYCHYGSAALAAVRAAGFTAAVTCQGLGSWDRYELRRAMITGKDGLSIFVLKLTELYQPLFDSRPGRFVRAATRGPRVRRRERLERRR
jgi:peptidoglycan/xylan/chitin deacetylase (PgdA/CDA1 family)